MAVGEVKVKRGQIYQMNKSIYSPFNDHFLPSARQRADF